MLFFFIIASYKWKYHYIDINFEYIVLNIMILGPIFI